MAKKKKKKLRAHASEPTATNQTAQQTLVNVRGKHGQELARDGRFTHAQHDPRFQRMPEKKAKVKVDNRFKEMFTNPMFMENHTVDKRGRALGASGAAGQHLKKLYRLEGDDADENDDEGDAAVKSRTGGESSSSSSGSSNSNSSEDDDDEGASGKQQKQKRKSAQTTAPPRSDARARQEYLTKLARGEISGESSSSDDEDDLDDLDVASGDDGDGQEDIPVGDATKRLAVMNLPWDHVRCNSSRLLLQQVVATATGGVCRSYASLLTRL